MKFSLFLLLSVLFTFTSNSIHKKTSVTKEVKKIYHQNLNTYLQSVERLNQQATKTNNWKTLQLALKNCRNAYKKVNLFIDYFDAEANAAHLNGAPLPKLEKHVPEVNVLEPEGLQVLDELVYAEEASDYATIKILTKQLSRQSKKIAHYQKTLSIEHRHIFEAIRQEIVRIFTLYLTNFDTPGSANGIEESQISLQNCYTTISVYKTLIQEKKPKLWTEIVHQFEQSIQYLNQQKDDDLFDHLHFYKSHLQAIDQLIYETHITLGIETFDEASNIPQAVNYQATQLFNTNYFNATYYAQVSQKEITAEKTALGKLLFFDPRLSVSQNMSCATCHQPKKAFTDGKKVNPISSADGLATIKRNTPTVINSVLANRYFYDLRAEKLAQQIEHVVVNNAEFHTNFIKIAARLRNIKAYETLFAKAYPNLPINKHTIIESISNYLVSLNAFNAPFDRYMRGETVDIAEGIKTGFNLFMGKAACATCHFPPSFSGLVPPLFQESESEVLGLTIAPEVVKLDPDQGRYTNGLVKEKAAHFQFSFKTPTLRNVALTAPYMHNGAFETLEEVFNFYNHGGGAGMGLSIPNQTLPTDSLHLTKTEIAALQRFMEALTDTTGLTNAPKVLPGGLRVQLVVE